MAKFSAGEKNEERLGKVEEERLFLELNFLTKLFPKTWKKLVKKSYMRIGFVFFRAKRLKLVMANVVNIMSFMS